MKQQILQTDLGKLIELNMLLSTVKSNNELLKVIIEKIKPIFNFYDVGIFVLSEDGLTHSDWAAVHPEIDGSEGNLISSPFSKDITHKSSPVEYIIEKIAKVKKPILYDFEELFENFPTYPQFENLDFQDIGYRDCLAYNLISQGKILGFFCINSLENSFFKPEQFDLFVTITNMVAISVGNILSNNKHLENDRIKSRLLEITEDITTSNTEIDLIKVIIEKVKPIFNFHDCGLFVLSEDGKTHSDWAAIYEGVSSSEFNDKVANVSKNIIHYNSPIDYFINECAKIDQPILFDFVDIVTMFPKYPQIDAVGILEMHYRDCLVYSLKSDGKIIGCFCINALDKNFFKESQFSVFQSVANIIAIAVKNIQSNEKQLENDRIKSRLLEITEDITTSNTEIDLIKVIVEKVKPIFNFHDCGLFVLSEDGQTHSDWAAIYEGVSPSELNDKIATLSKNVNHHNTPPDYTMNECAKIDKPILFDFVDLVARYPNNPQFDGTGILEMGYRDCLVYNLKSDGKIIGCFCINALEKKFFKESQFSVFQSVANIIAIAVKNIQSNEKQLENDRIKSRLLEITGDITTSNTEIDLIKVIVEKIQPIFNFHDCGLFVLSEDGQTHSDWAAIYEGVSPSELNDKIANVSRNLEHTNTPPSYFIDECSKNDQPILFDFVDIVARFSKYPQIDAVGVLEMGYRDCLVYNLKSDGKTIGCFCINALEKNFFKENQFPIFQSVANIIAIAVKNIVAKESLVTENTIKSKLLEITKDITQSSSEIQLVATIINIIKPMFDFYDCGLFVLSDDGTTHSDWAAIHETITENSNWNDKLREDLKKIKNVVHKGSPPEYFIETCKKVNAPVLMDFKDMVAKFPSYTQIDEMDVLEMGYRDCLTYNLIAEGEVIGLFCINALKKKFFKESQFGLFQSVTNIIAIAVKNIIAKERLLNEANKKSLEVDLAKKLAAFNDWEDRLLEVDKLLQHYLPNNLMMVNFEIKDHKCPTYAYYRTGYDEYQKLSKEDMLRISKMDNETFLNIRGNIIKTYERPIILHGNTLLENNKNNPIKENICAYFGLKSNLMYPLKLKKYGKVIFSFFSAEENNFTEDQVQFLSSLESTLQLIFDRTLAIEEIEKLNAQLSQKNNYLIEEVNSKNNFETIIGTSKVLEAVFKNVNMVANADTTVLVLGETGTGKELIARSLHNNSIRKNNSFIKVNCATLPAQLIESELFGHEKGSFTGALEKRIGKFELADKGSIFLDEIGELPLELQAKLLRVIQEKEFERIGGKQTIQCDVRIIAATNRILEKEVEKGSFRSDLYFRLNVFPINLPTLRDRAEDIPLLATYFAQKFCKKMNKPFKGIHIEMLEALQQYHWPGNIRELENVMEQAVIVNKGIGSLELARELLIVTSTKAAPHNIQAASENNIKTYAVLKEQKETLEKQAIIEALTATKGRVRGKNGAAILLDILPTTLESKMKKYSIFKSEFGMLGQ